MRRILTILDEIRTVLTREELSGGYFSKNDGSRVVVALDTAEDAAEAMLAYEQTQFDPDALGENYLRLYGFLQAVFLQQDALETLQMSFPAPSSRRTSGWRVIRELRNNITGHPVGRKNGDRVFLFRVSLSQWFFQYQIWNDKSEKPTFHEINLRVAYASYKREAVALLRYIASTLPKE